MNSRFEPTSGLQESNIWLTVVSSSLGAKSRFEPTVVSSLLGVNSRIKLIVILSQLPLSWQVVPSRLLAKSVWSVISS